MNTIRIILLGILLIVADKASGQGYVIDSVCQGAERHYRIDGEAGSTYTWVITDELGNSATLPETSDTVSIFWNKDAGNYILSTLQTSVNGCDSLELGLIKVFGIPYSYAGESLTRCGYSPFVLDGASATAYSSVAWRSSGDGTFSDSAIVNPTYIFGPNDISLGSVTFTLVANGYGMEGSCPEASSSFTITLIEEVFPVFASINPICHNSIPPSLQTVSTNGVHGQWTPSQINTEIVGTTDYVFTSDTSICPVSITLPITIYNETLPVFATISPLCTGSTAPLLPDTSLNGFTGSWYPPTISTATQGITIYSFTSYSGQCASSATIAIEVGNPEIINIHTTTATNGMANGVAEITAGGTALPFAYSLNGSDWQSSNMYDTLSAGIYLAWIKDANGCTSTKTFSIINTVTGDVGVLANSVVSCISLPIVIPVMAYDFTNIASFTIQLAFDSTLLDFTGLTNINGNLNSGNLTFVLISPGILQITFNTADSVTLLSEDRLFNLNFYGMASGYTNLNWSLQVCAVYSAVGYQIPSIYTNGAIEVRPAPQIYTNGNGKYCEGETLQISAQSFTGQNLTYNWESPIGEKHTGSKWDLGELSLSDSGIYRVTGIDSTSCAKTENVQLVVVPNPIVKLSEYEMLCSEQVIELNAGLGFADYVWQDGTKNPKLTATNEGIYWVIVTDTNGCKASDSVLLRPCELLIWMPTAFTPNGDELNDIFAPKYNLDLDFEFKMLVFNKWGEEIFSSSDIKIGWDGTFKGVPCPPDMYTWTISFSAPPTYNFLQKSPQSGLVMLLK